VLPPRRPDLISMLPLNKGCFLSLFAFLLVMNVNLVRAEEKTTNHARQNYILNCQGCHLADASGSKGLVPKMNDFVANFLHVDGGREFIVQVPGSANAPIGDQELADVLNWMLDSFSKDQIPANFEPYSGKEIGILRHEPLIDVNGTRAKLIERMQKKLEIKGDALNDV
jgi:hypothetical protein